MSDILPFSSLSLPSFLSHSFYLFKKKIIQDTLKKRMQVQVLQNTLLGVGSIPQYDNVWHCIRKTYSSKQAIFYCLAFFEFFSLVGVFLLICLFVLKDRYVFVYLSVCLSVCVSICLSVCGSVCLSVCLSLCLSVCLSVCLILSLSLRLLMFCVYLNPTNIVRQVLSHSSFNNNSIIFWIEMNAIV